MLGGAAGSTRRRASNLDTEEAWLAVRRAELLNLRYPPNRTCVRYRHDRTEATREWRKHDDH